MNAAAPPPSTWSTPHPLYAELQPGWRWFDAGDHLNTLILHDGGLHFYVPTEMLWRPIETVWPAVAKAMNDAAKAGTTGRAELVISVRMDPVFLGLDPLPPTEPAFVIESGPTCTVIPVRLFPSNPEDLAAVAEATRQAEDAPAPKRASPFDVVRSVVSAHGGDPQAVDEFEGQWMRAVGVAEACRPANLHGSFYRPRAERTEPARDPAAPAAIEPESSERPK